MRNLAETLNTRFFGDCGDRLSSLRAALEGVGLKKSTAELGSTSVLMAITTELDGIQSKGEAWRAAVVGLIQVAEVWSERQLAAHVLTWSRVSIH